MENLNNARIIKTLTDKEDDWGLWHFICELTTRLEQAEHKIECIKKNRDCDACEESCNVKTKWLLYIPDEDNKTWQRLIEDLQLDELHKWLIDASTSQEDLLFRLNKLKGLIGSMWSKDDWVKVWCMLNGFKPTPDLIVGKNLEIKRGIIPTASISNRIFKVVTQLDKSLTEDEVDEKVIQLNSFLLDRLHEIGYIINTTNSMIEDAEQILNPQPTPTKTEPQQTSKELGYLLGINGIKIAFDMAQEQGFMRVEGKYFRWLKENDLLAYFCEKLYNQFLTLTKSNKSWGYFSNIFISKGTGGKDTIPDGKKINRYKTDWKQDRLLEKTDPFCPDGSREIDLLIAMAKRKAEQ